MVEGRRADAELEPASPRNEKRLAEAAIFDDFLAALETYTLRATDAHREALAEIAATIDDENEYEKTTTEHDAVHGLLAQVGGA
ncbi:MAG TPA: hypothetical protein VLK89_01460 [Solirubrobacterales bacterium]|nr:hypothetical protein [Solirubrobacterales bacterium]